MSKRIEIKILTEYSKGHDEWWVEIFQCPNCGDSIPAEQKYCGECGKKLNWEGVKFDE